MSTDKQTKHYCAQFWQLPELVSLVASHLSHPGDLKNLCPASRSLRDAAMPILYHRMEIDLDRFREDVGILRRDHGGHKYIRHLVIKRPTQRTIRGDKDSWRYTLQHLLGILPQNKLLSLCTPDDTPLSTEILHIIFTKQRALRYMQLGPRDLYTSPPEPVLKTLEGIEVPEAIGSLAELESYGDLLQRSANMKELSIRAWKVRTIITAARKSMPLSYEYHAFYKDAPSELSTVFPHIFGRLQPGTAPLQLEKLLLCNQILLGAEQVLTPFIAFEMLCELQIHNCSDVDELLTGLSERFRSMGSKLRAFSLYELRNSDFSGDEGINKLESFLCSFEGLQFLEIRWDDCDADDFDLDCLETHLPTLTDLCLSFIDNEQEDVIEHNWYLDESEVADLLERSPKLRQLALALPNRHYGNNRQSTIGPETDLILKSSQIKVLRILNHPTRESEDSACTLDDLRDFANHIMRHVAQYETASALQFLCIGDCRPNERFITYNDLDELIEPAIGCYIRGVQTDCFGMTRAVAIPLPVNRVQLAFHLWDAHASENDQYCLGAADYHLLGRRG